MARSEDKRIDWSYTNARLYYACPRALYHRQLATSEGEEAARPIRVGSQPTGSIIGQAVHYGIASEIDEWRRGNEPSLHKAQVTATEELSSAYPDDGHEVSDEELKSVTSTVREHLQRFFRLLWPRFSSHRYISHEETTSFTVGSNTVWVKADLCTRAEDGTFVITDWKTKSPDVYENHTLQLNVYALWAWTEFEPELDQIRAQSVFTSTGEIIRRSISKSEIDTLVHRIKADSRAWNREFSKRNFPAQPSSEKCAQCLYLSGCAPGQRATSE